MGFLPIVLALSGFVFLWGIVNYNSFLTQQANIRRYADEKERLRQERTSLLSQLAALLHIYGLSLPVYLVHVANDAAYATEPTRLTKELQRTAVLIAEHPELRNNPDAGRLGTALRENNGQWQRTQNRLTSAVYQYNQYARKMPSRIIASLFGFHPVTT